MLYTGLIVIIAAIFIHFSQDFRHLLEKGWKNLFLRHAFFLVVFSLVLYAYAEEIESELLIYIHVWRYLSLKLGGWLPTRINVDIAHFLLLWFIPLIVPGAIAALFYLIKKRLVPNFYLTVWIFWLAQVTIVSYPI